MKIHIGLEHERLIVNRSGNIAHVKGKPQLSFPHDKMSCLSETRSYHYDSVSKAVLNFLTSQDGVDESFKLVNLGCIQGERAVPRKVAEACFEGDEKEAEERNFNLVRGGGLHVHFSLMKGHVRSSLFQNDLFVRICRERLDQNMKDWVRGKSHYRQIGMAGNTRVKAHGFEYRAVGWYGDKGELLNIAQRAYETVEGVLWDFGQMEKARRTPVFEDSRFAEVLATD